MFYKSKSKILLKRTIKYCYNTVKTNYKSDGNINSTNYIIAIKMRYFTNYTDPVPCSLSCLKSIEDFFQKRSALISSLKVYEKTKACALVKQL